MTEDDEIALLESQLSAIETDVLIAETLVKEPDAKFAEINKQREAIKAQMQEALHALDVERRRIEEEVFDSKRKIRSAKQERDNLQHRLDQARRRKLAEEKFEMLDTRWQRIFQSEAWATTLDHQIVGAKRIATQRKLILADTMGLGKTRTVLGALDLIYSMTEEATPENPVVLEGW